MANKTVSQSVSISKLQEAAAQYPAPLNNEVPHSSPKNRNSVRDARLARHIRTQLESRHAGNQRFLEILFKLTDEELLEKEREHHAAAVAAILARNDRSESTQRINLARRALVVSK